MFFGLAVGFSTVAMLGLSACATQMSEVRSSLIHSPELRNQRPNDIAVLPIEDRTADKKVSRLLSFMRAEIRRRLPLRRYAPLTSQAVDAAFGEHLPVDGSSIIDAAVLGKLAGKAEEDAVLAIQINRWDESSLRASGVVRFAAEITLLSSSDRRPLWSGGLEGHVKAGGLRPAPLDPRDRAKAAVSEFATQLLDRLPRRR